jgi:hypothetical protein
MQALLIAQHRLEQRSMRFELCEAIGGETYPIDAVSSAYRPWLAIAKIQLLEVNVPWAKMATDRNPYSWNVHDVDTYLSTLDERSAMMLCQTQDQHGTLLKKKLVITPRISVRAVTRRQTDPTP